MLKTRDGIDATGVKCKTVPSFDGMGTKVHWNWVVWYFVSGLMERRLYRRTYIEQAYKFPGFLTDNMNMIGPWEIR